ncbi:hypothetical protein [Streptococcus sanguinis]|uniref:Uncharacterized protein n=1 Tax=Streptococcus sanguinis TaxID=1305 RepID=A0A0B7GN51_STRSA|nr:hypothetical protein [Streptococcus sanguinis]CEL91121.1 conserved membrane protein of unknown function [Streptococcus sanguinis]
MNVLTKEYLKDTKRVYKDFCKKADDLEEAKDFIKNIPSDLLDEYKEVVFSEKRTNQVNIELVTNIVFSILFPSVAVYVAAVTIGVDNEVGSLLVAGILTVLFILELIYLDNKKKRIRSINLQRLFYFLENT